MKLYDFDGDFRRHLGEWMAASRGKYKNMDEMEMAAPDEYMVWMNKPADFLDGETPGMFFEKYDDAGMLVEWMNEYEAKGDGAPDLLLERIAELGSDAIAPLMELIENEGARAAARISAVNLLKEIDDPQPAKALLRFVVERRKKDDLADCCAEFLQDRGAGVLNDMIAAYPSATDEAKDTLLDILCNFPSDPRVFDFALDAFMKESGRRAINASYLEKLGDPRAIEPLKQVIRLSDINYLDYLEIRNAIEALGGETDYTREFAGDPYYESLRNME